MPSFTVRVELDDAASQADYDVLHAAMAGHGFVRIINGSRDLWFRLPTAEYNFVGDLAAEQVLQAAQRAARTTRKGHSVLVTEVAQRVWSGLEEI